MSCNPLFSGVRRSRRNDLREFEAPALRTASRCISRAIRSTDEFACRWSARSIMVRSRASVRLRSAAEDVEPQKDGLMGEARLKFPRYRGKLARIRPRTTGQSNGKKTFEKPARQTAVQATVFRTPAEASGSLCWCFRRIVKGHCPLPIAIQARSGDTRTVALCPLAT